MLQAEVFKKIQHQLQSLLQLSAFIKSNNYSFYFNWWDSWFGHNYKFLYTAINSLGDTFTTNTKIHQHWYDPTKIITVWQMLNSFIPFAVTSPIMSSAYLWWSEFSSCGWIPWNGETAEPPLKLTDFLFENDSDLQLASSDGLWSSSSMRALTPNTYSPIPVKLAAENEWN